MCCAVKLISVTRNTKGVDEVDSSAGVRDCKDSTEMKGRVVIINCRGRVCGTLVRDNLDQTTSYRTWKQTKRTNFSDER